MATLTQVTPELEQSEFDGLRLRKKGKTRLAIENAALDLFAEKGFEEATVDEIAERAEVSKATFFRYFASKADVIFSVEAYHFDTLEDAISERPKDEHDLVAIRQAVLDVWVPLLDPVRVGRQGRAAASSPVLRGMSFDLGVRWQTTVAAALARRNNLDVMDRRCWIVAGIALSVFSNATNCWLYRGAPGDLRASIEDTFDIFINACADARSDR
jgi:AcrR family transcriptional regulator